MVAVSPPEPPVPVELPKLTGCAAVRAEVAKYGEWNVALMTAISEAESSFRGKPCDVNAQGDGHLTYQLNGRTYGYSVSVFQVRILPGREHCDVKDITVNAKCAHAIWQEQGYSAWSVYTSGKYRKFL